MTRLFRLALCVLSTASLWGCAAKPGQDQTIPIGALLPMTGALSGYGSTEAEAIALALDHLSGAGGVLGKNLSLVTADDGSDPAKARGAAQFLINQKVPVIIGSVGSGVTLAAAELIAPAGIVQIATASTSPAVSSYADNGFLFRTCPSDAFQGKLLAQRARDKALARAAITYVPNPYGEGLAAAFADTFAAAGGTVAVKVAYSEAKDSYADLVAQLVGSDPDVIVLAGYPVDAAKIVLNYAMNYPGRNTFWMFGDALASTDFVQGAGAVQFTFPHEGTTFASPTGTEWQAFAAAYKAKTGNEAKYADAVGNAYDATIMAALAMQRSGSAAGAAIRDALYTLKTGPTYTPATLKDALAAAKSGLDFQFRGSSGPIVFDSRGDITAATYSVWKVNAADGAVEIILANASPR